LDGGDQRLLAARPGLQEARKVGARAPLGDREPDPAHAGVKPRGRSPLRSVTRSGLRSPWAAPIRAATSASINSAHSQATAALNRSACSALISSPTNSWAVIPGMSAIVVLLVVDLGKTDDLKAHGGRHFSDRGGLLHHSLGRDRIHRRISPFRG
jgi:hypothetical protein